MIPGRDASGRSIFALKKRAWFVDQINATELKLYVKLFHKRDLLLIFQNAMMYNSSKTDIYRMALEMERDVNQQVMLVLRSSFLNFSKVADFIGTQMMVEIDAWINYSVGTDTSTPDAFYYHRYRRKILMDSFIW